MTQVTCRLTAKNRNQLRNPTLGNRVWATFNVTFLVTINGNPVRGRCLRWGKYAVNRITVNTPAPLFRTAFGGTQSEFGGRGGLGRGWRIEWGVGRRNYTFGTAIKHDRYLYIRTGRIDLDHETATLPTIATKRPDPSDFQIAWHRDPRTARMWDFAPSRQNNIWTWTFI